MFQSETGAVRLPIEVEAYAFSTYELVPKSQMFRSYTPVQAAGKPSGLRVPQSQVCEVLHKFRRIPNNYPADSQALMVVYSLYSRADSLSKTEKRRNAGREAPLTVSRGTQTDKVRMSLTRLASRAVSSSFGGITVRFAQQQFTQDLAFERRGWRW